MRKIILCLLLLAASCSWADIREFENFSLDVPEGWTVSEDGPTVTIEEVNGTASLVITTGNPKGQAIGDIAASFSAELGGTMPERDDEGSYTFEFNSGRSQAIIAGGEELYMLIIGTGVGESEMLNEILDSLEMK